LFLTKSTMGILKNFEGDGLDNDQINSIPPIDLLTNVNQINHSDLSTDDDDDDDDEVENEVQVNVPQEEAPTPVVPTPIVRPVKVKKPVSKMPKPILHVKSLGGKKSQGNRQARRHENMCFLLNLARDLDEDFAAAVNIHDLVETTVSAFAQLLLNKNKMKIWNEFIELPENQQERLIKLTKKKDRSVKKRRESKSSSHDESLDSFVLIEKAFLHPTTTNDNDSTFNETQKDEATECFRRIDSNIRQTLKSLFRRDHLPLDRIRCFENDLIPFFSEHADSIYLRKLDTGFDRMILHAVCQYLSLISKSLTRDGERYTQVENRRSNFRPPSIRLSDFLQKL